MREQCLYSSIYPVVICVFNEMRSNESCTKCCYAHIRICTMQGEETEHGAQLDHWVNGRRAHQRTWHNKVQAFTASRLHVNTITVSAAEAGNRVTPSDNTWVWCEWICIPPTTCKWPDWNGNLLCDISVCISCAVIWANQISENCWLVSSWM